jgi:hypothetical protein
MVIVEFYDLKKTDNELKGIINQYTEQGWNYYYPGDDDSNEKPICKVYDNCGNTSTIENCLDILGNKLEIGNNGHILASKKLDFFNVIYNLKGSCYLVSDKNLKERLNIN